MNFFVNLMTVSVVMTSPKRNSNIFDNILMMHEDSEEETEDENEADDVIEQTKSNDEIIKESKAILLHRHSSEFSPDERFKLTGSNSSKKMAGKIPREHKQPTSILGTKCTMKATPTIQDAKKKKAVRFNMDRNQTCEIIQPELNGHNGDDDEDDNNNNNNNNKRTMSRNVRFADDLDTSDNEDGGVDTAANNEDHKDGKEHILQVNGFHSDNNKEQINDDITVLAKKRQELLTDIEKLQATHETEMKKLRLEYQRRREDYYSELDEVRMEVDEERSKVTSAVKDDLNNNTTGASLRGRVERETKILETQEQQLAKKKLEIEEQEQELKDYQRYLERRHKSLNEKEVDLCTLQDELEEFEDVLKAKKEKLLNEKGRMEVISKTCSHDENEIERTRVELIDSIKTEAELRESIRMKDNDSQKNLEKILRLEDENRKLQSKVRSLESQLTINLKSSAGGTSLVDRRINMRTMSSIPVDLRTGEYITPKTISSCRNSSRNSPNPFSPISSTCSSPSHELIKSPLNSPLNQPKRNNNVGEHTNVDMNQEAAVTSKTCAIM